LSLLQKAFLNTTAFEGTVEEVSITTKKKDVLIRRCFGLGAVIHITDFIKLKKDEGLLEEEIIDAIGSYKEQIVYN